MGGNVNDDVVIAVDPHKPHNTLAVLDPTTRRVVGEVVGSITGADAQRLVKGWTSSHA
jgi:hypothetical protein